MITNSPVTSACPFALIGCGIANVGTFNMEASEGLTYVRMVIDAHHHHALAAAHECGHAPALLEREVVAVACGLSVRRIYVEERLRGVLDVRERLGPSCLLLLEDLPGAARTLELADDSSRLFWTTR